MLIHSKSDDVVIVRRNTINQINFCLCLRKIADAEVDWGQAAVKRPFYSLRKMSWEILVKKRQLVSSRRNFLGEVEIQFCGIAEYFGLVLRLSSDVACMGHAATRTCKFVFFFGARPYFAIMASKLFLTWLPHANVLKYCKFNRPMLLALNFMVLEIKLNRSSRHCGWLPGDNLGCVVDRLCSLDKILMTTTVPFDHPNECMLVVMCHCDRAMSTNEFNPS